MFAFLRSLSDSVILSRMLELTRRERSVTLQVLVHLQEIETRKLHLKQGYASMFAYCTRELGYSESAANLRIRTARCLARFPEVHDLLAANEINPSTLSQVARILTPLNRSVVLSRIRGKSQREVEAIVAEYEPRTALPGDRVRTVVVRVPVKAMENRAAPVTVPAPEWGNEWQEIHRCNSGEREMPAPEGDAESCSVTTPTVPACTAPTDGLAVLETRKVFKFTASEGFEKKLERIKSLASHRLSPNPSFEQVFELAMDCFLEREDPAERVKRRARRHEREQEPRGDAPGRGMKAGNPRYISQAVRDQVFVRDRSSCAFRGPDGRRCGSTFALQVDHITPVARGGRGTVDNLRLLCAHHNRLEAERLMGVTAASRKGGPVTTAPATCAR